MTNRGDVTEGNLQTLCSQRIVGVKITPAPPPPLRAFKGNNKVSSGFKVLVKTSGLRERERERESRW